MNAMTKNGKEGLKLAVGRIESLLGNNPDGSFWGGLINAPKSDDPNLIIKNSLIEKSDSIRALALNALENDGVFTGVLDFDESIYLEIEEHLSSDHERQSYIDLVGAMHKAALLLSSKN